ncbi:MAG TPA: YoaK family protein [Solirubrobacteraceae bacterium]|nr:YoaK family protein [Solirubrobacteraceae bacterium]
MSTSATAANAPRRLRHNGTRDVLLAALAFAAGAVDAMSWLALGKVFSGFMTGNALFIGIGLTQHLHEVALHGAIALVAFGAGAGLTAAALPPHEARAPWFKGVTVSLAVSALVQLVFFGLWLAVSGRPGSSLWILLAVSAFAMGIQTAAVVSLGVHAIFTTAVTATWTVLVGDLSSWSETRSERRRLAMVLAGAILGALAGSLLIAHARLWMPLLPIVVTAGVAASARAVFKRAPASSPGIADPAIDAPSAAFGRSSGVGAIWHGR